jgi:hypothetical protein
MVLIYSDAAPVDQRPRIYEYAGIKYQADDSRDPNMLSFPANTLVQHNAYNIIVKEFKCAICAISGELTLQQLKYYSQRAKVFIRLPKLDIRFSKTQQLTKALKQAFSQCFVEPTVFGHFKEHIMGGSDLHTNLFLQGDKSNCGMKAWIESLSRHYLNSNCNIYVNDGCLFAHQLPLVTLSATSYKQACKEFSACGLEAAAAIFRVILVVDNVTKAVTLNTWIYSNYECDIELHDQHASAKYAWEVTCPKLVNPDILAELWMRFVNVELKADILSPTGAVNSFEGVPYDADIRDLTGEFKSPTRK